jgi:isoprenylcysteine carboxyl methyltransferase (ICMT) family protein YpbQ
MFGACLRLIIYNKISLVNERKLKSNNAKEYGKMNSKILNILHYVFFGGCITEAYIRKTQFDFYTIIGLILYVFAYIMLIYVIKELKGFWTNKVIIAEDHQLNTSFLYRYIKHPNYFFNLLPELI